MDLHFLHLQPDSHLLGYFKVEGYSGRLGFGEGNCEVLVVGPGCQQKQVYSEAPDVLGVLIEEVESHELLAKVELGGDKIEVVIDVPLGEGRGTLAS